LFFSFLRPEDKDHRDTENIPLNKLVFANEVKQSHEIATPETGSQRQEILSVKIRAVFSHNQFWIPTFAGMTDRPYLILDFELGLAPHGSKFWCFGF
jgi:hypothetical protein